MVQYWFLFWIWKAVFVEIMYFSQYLYQNTTIHKLGVENSLIKWEMRVENYLHLGVISHPNWQIVGHCTNLTWNASICSTCHPCITEDVETAWSRRTRSSIQSWICTQRRYSPQDRTQGQEAINGSWARSRHSQGSEGTPRLGKSRARFGKSFGVRLPSWFRRTCLQWRTENFANTPL